MSKRIFDFQQLTTPATNDIVLVDDISAGATKYITLSDLMQMASAIQNNAIQAAMLATNAITLGYAEVTTSQGPITTAVDLTGLSVTVTVPSGGRRVRVTHFANNVFAGAANSRVETFIQDGSTVLNTSRTSLGTLGACVVTSWVGTPSAGSHTYKIVGACDSGTSITYYADATSKNFILVEMI